MTEQTADNRHRQSFIQCEDSEGVAGNVHREVERQSYLFPDHSQRLVDTLGCIVTGFIERFGIIEVETLFYQIKT